jgi:hypothetical protein
MEIQRINPAATVVLEARGELADIVNLTYIFRAVHWGEVVQTISIEQNKTIVFVKNMPSLILADLKRHPIVLELHNVSWNIYLINELDVEEHDLWSDLVGKENTSTDIIAPVKLTSGCGLSAPTFTPASSPIVDALYGKVDWSDMNIDLNW